MKRKRISLLVIILALAIVFSAAFLVACDDNKTGDDTTAEIEATEGLLISNSDFKVTATSGDYPRSLTNWTGGKLYSSSTVPGGVVAGAVNMSAATYEQYRHLWNDDEGELYNLLTAGGRYGDDDAIKNALMIYMPTEDLEEDDDDDFGPTAYGYTSASFTLDSNSYYVLSVDVLTYDIAGDDTEGNVPGARIYLSSSSYGEISGIDTNGEWKTYEIFIESNPTSSSSLTVNLGLGKYSSYYKLGLTSGYAFFDNVTLTKINADDVTVEQAREQFDAAAAEEQAAFDAALEAFNGDKAAAEGSDAETTVKSLDARYCAISPRTVSAKVPNGRFDFGSTSISTSAPSGWSLTTGSGADTSYRFNGIISASAFQSNYTSYAGTYYLGGASSTHTPASALSELTDDMLAHLEESVGDSVYMLSQQMMTAQGIKTSSSVTIEKNKFYAISVDVLTYNVYGGGVSLILSGDGEDIVIEGISENKYDGVVRFGESVGEAYTPANDGWETYTFYIKGNQYKDMSYNLTLWLGTGTAEENAKYKTTYTHYSSTSSSGTSRNTYTANGTFSSGWAFFDDLTMATYPDLGAFDAASEGAYTGGNTADGDAYFAIRVDLSSESYFDSTASDYAGIDGNFAPESGSATDWFADTDGKPAGFDIKPVDEENAADAPVCTQDMITAGSVDLSDGDYFAALGLTAPGTPYTLPDGVTTGLMIKADSATVFTLKSDEFDILPNSAYRLSVWVKTQDVKATTGAYIYLNTTEDEETTTLSSFKAANTADVEENNGWVEYTFVIRGGDKATSVWLELALGTGTRWSSSTLAKGAAFFANLNMTDITYSDFTGTSAGTYVNKVDRSASSSSGNFENGSFDNIDFDEMEEAISAGAKGFTLDTSDTAGVPDGWTLSDQTIEDEKFVSGVIRLAASSDSALDEWQRWGASTQIKTLFPDDVAFFDNIYSTSTTPSREAASAPNMLAIAALGEDAHAAGYLSDSFTLSASENYSVSVWAKAEAGTKGMIFLQGESGGSLQADSADESVLYFAFTGDGSWHKYTFNIEVGLTSVSLQLGLWLGENAAVTGGDADAAGSTGIVVYDAVNMTSGIEDDKLADYSEVPAYEHIKTISFMTDSFDTMEGEDSTAGSDDATELDSPNGWTGSVGTDQDRDNTVSGVLDIEQITTDGDYITGLGPELSVDDFSATAQEIEDYCADNGLDYANEAERAQAEAAVKQMKYEEARRNRLLPVQVVDGENEISVFPEGFADGSNVLVINNIANSAYRYGSTGFTLTAERAYKVSVRVFTYGIGYVSEDGVFTAVAADADGVYPAGAYVELYLGTAHEDDHIQRFDGIVTGDGFATYTFYVLAPTDDVSSVSLRLGLGLYDADDEAKLVSGYAFFDMVTIQEIGDVTDYDETVAGITDKQHNMNYLIPEEAERGAVDEDEDDVQTPDNTFDLNSLWWMIPTIIIGLAIIAVVVVFFVRKYRKKFAKKSSDDPTDSVSSANVNRKKGDYDSYNE